MKPSAELPTAASLFEAFTAVNANEAVNMERLELLGDSFLKFVASLRVFATSLPKTDEGQLTYVRIRYISNANLHRIACKFGFFRYIASCIFQPERHYIPPYFAITDPVSTGMLSLIFFQTYHILCRCSMRLYLLVHLNECAMPNQVE